MGKEWKFVDTFAGIGGFRLLQRFPDTFVLPERDNAAYRQVGNAVTVDVVSAILWKIIGKM